MLLESKSCCGGYAAAAALHPAALAVDIPVDMWRYPPAMLMGLVFTAAIALRA